MGADEKHTEKEILLSVRQMYCTVKEPDKWKPGYQGITIPISIGKRIIKAMTAVLESGDVPEIIEARK